jgi:hypothetical protein
MRAHTLFSCFGASGIRIEGKVQEPDHLTFSLTFSPEDFNNRPSVQIRWFKNKRNLLQRTKGSGTNYENGNYENGGKSILVGAGTYSPAHLFSWSIYARRRRCITVGIAALVQWRSHQYGELWQPSYLLRPHIFISRGGGTLQPTGNLFLRPIGDLGLARACCCSPSLGCVVYPDEETIPPLLSLYSN